MSQGNCLFALLSFNSCDTNFDATLSPRQVARNFMRKFHESVTQAAWKKKIPGIFRVKIIESAPWIFACTLCNMYHNQIKTELANQVSCSCIEESLRYTVLLCPWGSTARDFAPATPLCKMSLLMSGLLYPVFPVGINGHQEKFFSSNQLGASEFLASGLIFHNRDQPCTKKMHFPCVRREWEMRGTNACIEPSTSEG